MLDYLDLEFYKQAKMFKISKLFLVLDYVPTIQHYVLFKIFIFIPKTNKQINVFYKSMFLSFIYNILIVLR